MKWGTTDQVTTHGVKMLVYGLSGAGKTHIIQTLPTPIIGSAESGLLTLRKLKIPYGIIATYADLLEFYQWCAGSAQARQFQSIALDSISEIAEVVLANERKFTKDPRQAFGETIIKVIDVVRLFRDLPGFNVYVSAKAEYTKDDTGRLYWAPMMPGQKLGPQLPYHFDEVFYAGIGEYTDTVGKLVKYHYLQTAGDSNRIAKDRSGVLSPMEPPDLGHIIHKITGV